MNIPQTDILLELDDLRIVVEKNKQEVTLVDGLSFLLKKGEILGIVGESGSGKSITTLALMQLLAPALDVKSGVAKYNGRNLLNLTEKEIRPIRGKEIAMIFQEPMSSMNPSMTCGSQIEEMIFIHEKVSKEEAKTRTLELLDLVKLPDVRRAYAAYPHELSGGQLQRIMIAMAMACKPQLLIADECTTALDVTVQQEIVALLKLFNQKFGTSILFISHDLGVIADIADRVLVMKQGKLIELDSVHNIFQSSKDPYTKQLINSRPPLDIQLSKLPDPRFFEKDNFDFQAFIEEHTLDEKALENSFRGFESESVCFEVKSLSKTYTTKTNFWGKPTAFVHAVKDVSFQIREGETIGLVGESGCGKSTLSKAMMRLIEADSGDALYKGKSLYGMSTAELRNIRKEIQYIFQDPYSSLNPRKTIGQAILEPMEVHRIGNSKKERKDRVIDLLEKVGLKSEYFNRYPHEFSGGQRQRICIARALGLEPRFIVCDEIVSALDVSVQAQVLNLLKDLKKEFKLSLLFVTHDMAVVKFISDRILVMKQGQIVEEGIATNIYHNPQHPYTQTLIDAIPGKSLRS